MTTKELKLELTERGREVNWAHGMRRVYAHTARLNGQTAWNDKVVVFTAKCGATTQLPLTQAISLEWVKWVRII